MLLGACSADSQSEASIIDDCSQGEGPLMLIQEPARGIAIREIEVNQGTRVVIGEGGEWLDREARPIGLIAGRDALLRIHYEVDPSWIARPIEARLTLEYPDGTLELLTATKQVEGDSTPDSLDGGFWFPLSAAAGQTAAEVAYRVELWDTGDELGDELPELAWANPAEGPLPIGFEAIPLEMKVVFVPIHYLPLDLTPKLDDAAIQELVDDLYEQNPTNSVTYEVRTPLDHVDELDDLATLLPSLSELKVADAAEANIYYHALVDVGGPTVGGQRGIGNIVGDGEGEGAMRVAATVYWAGDPSLAVETFTHELGHNQGLTHVMCPSADATGIEFGYPHENGWIGSWGAGVRRQSVFAPDQTFDYMSYCGPSWVSDWTWTKTLERIATLTAWDYQGNSGDGAGQTSILIGALQIDGSTHWWTAPGSIDPERVSGQDRVTFVTDEGQIVERWAQVDTLSDGETQWIKVELPAAFEHITTITHQRGEASVVIPTAAVVTELAVDPWQPTRAGYSAH